MNNILSSNCFRYSGKDQEEKPLFRILVKYHSCLKIVD
jgi:hypothetical protein